MSESDVAAAFAEQLLRSRVLSLLGGRLISAAEEDEGQR